MRKHGLRKGKDEGEEGEGAGVHESGSGSGAGLARRCDIFVPAAKRPSRFPTIKQRLSVLGGLILLRVTLCWLASSVQGYGLVAWILFPPQSTTWCV